MKKLTEKNTELQPVVSGEVLALGTKVILAYPEVFPTAYILAVEAPHQGNLYDQEREGVRCEGCMFRGKALDPLCDWVLDRTNCKTDLKLLVFKPFFKSCNEQGDLA